MLILQAHAMPAHYPVQLAVLRVSWLTAVALSESAVVLIPGSAASARSAVRVGAFAVFDSDASTYHGPDPSWDQTRARATIPQCRWRMTRTCAAHMIVTRTFLHWERHWKRLPVPLPLPAALAA